MAKSCYNTFVVSDCKTNRVLLVTSSARKARDAFGKGRRVEVWNCNSRVERITVKCRDRNPLGPYVEAERDFIRQRQKNHEDRNKRRRLSDGKRTEFASW